MRVVLGAVWTSSSFLNFSKKNLLLLLLSFIYLLFFFTSMNCIEFLWHKFESDPRILGLTSTKISFWEDQGYQYALGAAASLVGMTTF